MRYFEIICEAQEPRIVLATSRFNRELPEMSRGYPETPAKLAAFLHFRETAPSAQGFNKKDYPYASDSSLVGFRHVHLVFGKVVLTYQLTNTAILLCALTDHMAIEGARSRALAGYLNKLNPADYAPLSMPAGDQEKRIPVTEEEISGIMRYLYELASHPDDRAMIEATAAGKIVPDLWDLLGSMVETDLPDDEKRKAILDAFGGVEGFISKIKQILKHTSPQ
jgi:hypothetical protein